LRIDLEAGSLSGGGQGGAGRASLAGIENVVAGYLADRISGSAGANVLDGHGGDDTLEGLGGDDTLHGYAGRDLLFGGDGDDRLESGEHDTLTGGAGADDFAVTFSPNEASVITDFASGVDELRFEGSAFMRIGASDFTTGDARFHAAAGASAGHDADDRVIFNTTTGEVYYDSDGAGSQAAQLVARLQAGATLAASDIGVDNGIADQEINGGPGDDTLVGGGGFDTINGFSGNDTLEGRLGDDVLQGGAGNDFLVGHDGVDSLIGGDGNDTLDGKAAWDWDDEPYLSWNQDTQTWEYLPGDTLDGGLGDDVYRPQPNDVIVDAGGIDTIEVFDTGATLPDGLENLTEWDGYDSEGGGTNTLNGNALDNVIRGGWTASVLDGGAGNDTIFGGESYRGNDVFRFSLAAGDYGNDHLDGESEGDILDFADARSAIVADLAAGTLTGGGTNGSGSAVLLNFEAVFGGAFDDRLVAGDDVQAFGLYPHDGAQYVLKGGAGNDTLVGGAANDELWGGGGDDRIEIRGGFDRAEGEAGTDTFVLARSPGGSLPEEYSYYPSAVMIVDFTSGSEKIVLDAAFHSAIGPGGDFAPGDERFYAAAGATSGHDATDRVIHDTASGYLYYDADGDGSGASEIIAYVGRTLAATDLAVENGAAQGQQVIGTAGNDSLQAGSGNDTLDGLGGVDTMNGGQGNDLYIVTAGDVLSDPGGIDTVQTAITWSLGDDFENLTMTGSAAIQVQGNGANNFIIGNSGNNYFNARHGNDTIQAGDGNDSIDVSSFNTGDHGDDVVDGGANFDSLDFDGYATTGLVADFNTGTITGGDAAGSTVTFSNIEQLVGGGFADRMTGNAAANDLMGRGGNDTLQGGAGNDTLTGGAGSDSFVFAEAPGAANADQINGFVSADQLLLDNAAFTAIGATGNFASGDARFWSSSAGTAHDANDRVVYNTSTGNLYYDADGSGTGAAQLIATLAGNPSITATDITVV
jgi:Ca2+-binding RTX toxin-like protein